MAHTGNGKKIKEDENRLAEYKFSILKASYFLQEQMETKIKDPQDYK